MNSKILKIFCLCCFGLLVVGGNVMAAECGSANGQSFPSAPTSNLCASGQASAVSGTGPWTWTCHGWSQKLTQSGWSGADISLDGKYQIVGNNSSTGQVYVSNDYGVTWTARTSAGIWNSVAMSATGQYQTAVGTGRIYISNDYGVTWTPKGTSQSWFSVDISSTGQYQIAEAIDLMGVYVSSDYGATWSAKTLPGQRAAIPQGVSISSDGKYMATGNYISSNYGATWTQSGSFYGKFLAMSSSGQYQLAGTQDGKVYFSSNYGVTWTNKALGLDSTDVTVAISSTGQYQITATNSLIYGSSDYGNTWQTIPYPGPGGGVLGAAISGTGQYQVLACNGYKILGSSNFFDGGTVSCSANLAGGCGTQAGAQHRLLTSSSANLCTTGVTATNFSGGTYGPWTWKCSTSTCNATLTNSAPTISNITPASTVNEGATLALSVTASDTNNDALTYAWACTGGTVSPVSSRTPTYTAPQVTADTNYTCSVLITDGFGGTAIGSVTITVKDTTNYCGTQAGAQHRLLTSSSANLCTTGVTATNFSGGTYGPWTWKCSTSTCSATLSNNAPIISAITPTSNVNEGKTLALSVTASDANNDALTYAWACTGGTVSPASSRTPTYTAPTVMADAGYVCSVLITDGFGGTATGAVGINVKNVPLPEWTETH